MWRSCARRLRRFAPKHTSATKAANTLVKDLTLGFIASLRCAMPPSPLRRRKEKTMDANNNAIRKALTALVNYLNKEVERTSKCKRCRYRGKSFRGEPCYWHVDCGIDASDDKASDNAMYLLKRFKLQEALSAPPRNCDMPLVVDGPADNNADKAWLVFKRHNPDAYFDVPGLLRCIDWLLATVTELKGGNDGR